MVKNKKVKRYVVALYEDGDIKSALWHKAGCWGAFVDVDEKSLPNIKFFSTKQAAQRLCDEYNAECSGGIEKAVVEEYVFNVK